MILMMNKKKFQQINKKVNVVNQNVIKDQILNLRKKNLKVLLVFQINKKLFKNKK